MIRPNGHFTSPLIHIEEGALKRHGMIFMLAAFSVVAIVGCIGETVPMYMDVYMGYWQLSPLGKPDESCNH
jgi:hypothetical protein